MQNRLPIVVLPNKDFLTKIRKNVRLAEAPLEKRDITVYDKNSNGARDYSVFAEEFLTVMKEEYYYE